MTTGNLTSSFFANQIVSEVVLNPTSPTSYPTFMNSPSKMGYIKSVVMKLFKWLTNPKSWQESPKVWIFSLWILRSLYVVLKEYGWLRKKSLDGDHVFLTGAGSGIGRMMAVRFGKLGCYLSLSDINMQGLEQTKQECLLAGIPADKIYTFQLDVASREGIREAAASAQATFGTVTVLVNNAGIVSAKQTTDLSDQMVERTFAVNTLSHFYTIKEFLPAMIEKKRGHVVTIASMAAFSGIPMLSDYTASKAGAFMCDESLRHELSKLGHSSYIKTTCICPYFINTGMFDGAKSAFPFSILDPVPVVDRIMAAVQQEEA